MVARERDGYVAGSACRWAVVEPSDRLVGTCGFSNWSLLHSHAELVYDLDPAFWGRGLIACRGNPSRVVGIRECALQPGARLRHD